jgi:cell filamentation protein
MFEEEDALQDQLWNSYFWEPGGQVLRNLYGVKDQGILSAIEYAQTASRELEIARGDAEIPRTYDGDHLRAIHQYLFQDVYEWAGKHRRVDMSKDLAGEEIVFAPTDLIDGAISEAADVVRSVDWPSTDQTEFAHATAETYSWLNYAHPFREGNGRAAKVFLHHVAEQSPWRLNFGALDTTPPAGEFSAKDLWNLTSGLSIAHGDIRGPKAEVMYGVFRSLSESRDAPPEPPTAPASPALDRAAPAPAAVSGLEDLRARIARLAAANPTSASAAVASGPESAGLAPAPADYTAERTTDLDTGPEL